jgi:hypothetical protein
MNHRLHRWVVCLLMLGWLASRLGWWPGTIARGHATTATFESASGPVEVSLEEGPATARGHLLGLELEADGVISRQNFWCCGTCGASAIGQEMEDADKAGRPARGYVFYHEQDTESAVGGYGLHLNYGAREQTDEAAVTIGHEIVAHLNRHGLQTDWDGRIERRIAVSLDWKRRRQNTPA